MKIGIKDFSVIGSKSLKNDAWLQFCENHSDMHIIQTCFENFSPPDFWSLDDEYPDIVTRLHTQVRLMGSFGLNSVPWFNGYGGCLMLYL